MIVNTPIIGKIPNLKPEWMNENNGVWTNSFNEIVDIIANFTQNWLEDNINESLYDNMTLVGESFTDKEVYSSKVNDLFDEYFNKRIISFEEQLEKIKLTEEKI